MLQASELRPLSSQVYCSHNEDYNKFLYGFLLKTTVTLLYEAGDYIFFYHPPFDYLSENDDVMARVENLAWNFDPTTIGYEWNEDKCQDYQCHYPEGHGYMILRPVKKIK